MEVLRKSATATYVEFPLISSTNRPDYKAGESYPFVAGDVKVIKHAAGTWNVANINTLPAEISSTGIFLLTLTAGELTPDDTSYPVTILIKDQTSPKIFDDTCVIVSFKVPDEIAALQTDITTIKGYTDSIESVLGTPAGASVSADIAAVKADCVTIKGYTDTIESVLGTPAGASMSADIAAVKADAVTIKGYTDTLETVIGSPAGVSVSADIAALKSDTTLIKGYTDSLETTIGSPAGASVSADIAAVKANCVSLLSDTIDIKGYTDSLEGSMTTALADLVTIKGYTDNVESDLSTAQADITLIKGYTDSLEGSCTTLLADTATLKGDTTTIKSDLSTTKSDVATIKSKLPLAGDLIACDADLDDVKSKVGTIYTALPSGAATIASQNDVLSIQNNTNFAASIVASIVIPESPNLVWVPITCQLRDSTGSMEDPDDNEMTVQVRSDDPFEVYTDLYTTRNGDVLLTESSTFPNFYKLTKISTGVYEGWMKVASTVDPGSYTLTFKYKESTITQVYTRNTNIIEADVDINVSLADSTDNKTIIAKALKSIDVSGVSTITGSIMNSLKTDLGTIIAKLPSGTISDLALTTKVENNEIQAILSLIMAMIDGKYTINNEDGTVTFFKRDNTTPVTIVKVTETARTREALPS